MSKWRRLLRYEWPLHLMLLATNWLPDNVIFLRLRGWMAHWFIGGCGTDLRLGRNVTFYNPALVTLGSSVYIAYGCILLAVGHIEIGDEVMLAPYAVLSAGEHTRQHSSYRRGAEVPLSITIGHGTWVGAHATVLGGANVGRGCLIGSQACVTRDSYAAGTLLVGVPAVPKKHLEDT